MLVDQREHTNRSPVAGAIGDEVVAPDVILLGWAQPHARSVGEPQSLPFRLLLRDFQPLLTPETLHALVIDRPSLAPQERRHPAVAVAAVLAREFHDPLEQARLVARDMPLPLLRTARLAQHLASRQAKLQWAKLKRSPATKIMRRIRQKFFERVHDLIEIEAARLLDVSEGESLQVPTTTIDCTLVNSPVFASTLRELSPDILIMSACPILKALIFDVPRLGTINVHRGIAPTYRGERTIFWPLYFREYEHIGVTLHLIDRGIDTGPILGYGFPELTSHDNEATIVAKCIEIAADMVTETVTKAGGEKLVGYPSMSTRRCFCQNDQRILKEWNYRVGRALGLRTIPARSRRVEMPPGRQIMMSA